MANDGVTFRLAREEDLPAMRLIQRTAQRDLVSREGGDPSRIVLTDEPHPEIRHLLTTDPDLAWIAIGEGRPIGFSVGFVRGDLWFLSDLFMLPEAHAKGIGASLLNRCLDAGLRRGGRVRSVSSSTDRSAQSLYIRAQMVPRFPLYEMLGSAKGLRDLQVPRTESVKRADTGEDWIDELGGLDEYVWGHRRADEHRFWERSGAVRLIAKDAADRLAGYVYCSAAQAGPMAARSAPAQLQLLRAVGDAVGNQDSSNFRLTVPGINATMLEALLHTGFRIEYVGTFMASRPFGRFDRYVPSGGTLF
jgi:GNAT superfamily N-acetyltransferase